MNVRLPGKKYKALLITLLLNVHQRTCLFISFFFKSCHEHAEKFLKQKNGESQHVIHAMGHCHIDTGTV
jgi:hypothetical protein